VAHSLQKEHVNRFWRIVIVLSGIAAVLAGTAVLFCNQPGIIPRPTTGARDGFSVEEMAQIEDGDIVLRKGVGTISDFIVIGLGGGLNVSHCAMVVRHADGPWAVHTLNGSLTGVDGVQSQPVSEFNRYTEPGTLAVLRPLWKNAEQKGRAIAKLQELLKANIPFDNNYNLEDRSRLYCSELLVQAMESAGFYPKNFKYDNVMGVLSFTMFMDPSRYKLVLSHNPGVRARMDKLAQGLPQP